MAKKYYKSQISGLTVILGSPKNGEVEPEKVRFSPFEEKEDGERIKVGYLATDDERAHERLAEDPNVEEIDKDEYKKRTDTSNSKVRPLPL